MLPRPRSARFDAGRIVGFALTCTDGDRAYNSSTGVAPAHRRGGLARRLVDAVIASVPARRYVLEVIETNAPAVALYRAAGFGLARRHGHGARLLAAAAARAGAPLHVLNLDERAAGIAAFLDATGATRTVCQLEMVRELP